MSSLAERSPAHQASHRFRIDPFPEKKRGSNHGKARWLYFAGDMEAFQVQRMRVESHWECINVLHPGLYRAFSHHLFFRKIILLKAGQSIRKFRVGHSGTIHLACNDRAVLHTRSGSAQRSELIDVTPCLRAGENYLVATVSCLGAPPTFLMEGEYGTLASEWEISNDGFHYQKPAVFAETRGAAYPHERRLPVFDISPRSFSDGLYDFGLELLGYPVASGSGSRGVLSFFPGESRAEANNRDPQKLEQPVEKLSFGNDSPARGNKVAFRYLGIDAPASTTLQRVWCEAEYRPVEYRGAFACSDDQLTRIWQHSAYTLHLCLREFFVDGLKRDRLPWVGDLYVAIAANAFSFADRDIVRSSLTALAPEKPEQCHINGILDYTLYWVMCLRLYHIYFDDLDYVKSTWSNVEKIFATLEASEDAHHCLQSRKGDWVFIDWAEINKKGTSTPLQMLYIMALDAGAFLASLSGQSSASAQWAKKSTALKKLSRKRFWSGQKAAFVSNIVNRKMGVEVTRHANVLAALSGVADTSQRQLILSQVLHNPRIPDVGTPYMRFFEYMAHSRLGAVDSMLDGVSSYWGAMLDKGATTFWETFDPSRSDEENLAFYGRPFGNSLCHAWASGPLALLSSDLWGLELIEPGWKKIRIKPDRSRLDWAKVTWPTPHGEIQASMENGRVTVSLPTGVQRVK